MSEAEGLSVVRAVALVIACAACCFPLKTHAQVYEITGGSSSLYDAAGGSFSVHGPNYDATVGAGLLNGKFVYGAKTEKEVGPTTYLAGDEEVDVLLPTDVFDSSHYLYTRGLGMKTTRDGIAISAFAGAASTYYQEPMFEGGDFGSGMGYLSVSKQIAPKWKVVSQTLVSSKVTEIEAVQWTPQRRFVLAMSAGVGANQPYAAASVKFARRMIDVVGSYVAAGPNFKRIVVTSPIQAEPDKGNLQVTFKPAYFLSLSGGMQNFLVENPLTNQNESSSVRSASVNMVVARASVSGTVYDSMAQGETTHAAAFSASRDVTRWGRVMSSYMVARPQGTTATSSFFTTITETLNQHISVNENISTSNGQTSFYYGGSLLTNRLSVSANYETYYVPLNPASPFQQSLMLDASLRLFGRLSLHGGTFVGPTGKLMYTATATGIMAKDIAGSNGMQPSLGNSTVRILVADTSGKPVDGAALMVDARAVFTNDDGRFELRESKPRSHTLAVLTDKFLEDGRWEVASMPRQVWSSPREDDPETVIVVRRIPCPAEGCGAQQTAMSGAGHQ